MTLAPDSSISAQQKDSTPIAITLQVKRLFDGAVLLQIGGLFY